MKIINLGVRPKWKITKDDIKNASSDDLILMKIPGGMILLKIRDMLNRYKMARVTRVIPVLIGLKMTSIKAMTVIQVFLLGWITRIMQKKKVCGTHFLNP